MGILRPRGATPPPEPSRRRRTSRRRTSRPRAGFTMVEVLLVIGMIGAVAAIAVPRFRAFRESAAVRAARLQLSAAVETARAAAIQRGRTARVRVRGDSVLVTVDTGGVSGPATGRFTVLATIALKKEHEVTVTLPSSADTIVGYDSRGIASPRMNAVRIYVLQRGAFRDSLCVSRLGMILGTTCAP